jgi:RHS repeat-associated protein
VEKVEAGQTTMYQYDPDGRLMAETLATGAKIRDYIYLGNKLVAVSGCVEGVTSSTCDGLQWYHTDALGSVLARTDANGVVVAHLDYQPWGEQWQPAGVQGDRQYNGRVYDSGTGFHDYGARMYWPQVGRFISPDPAGIHPENPQSWNRYAYVWNNPYKYVDPSGKEVAIQWHEVAFDKYHTSIRITPENQAAYEGDARFNERDGQGRHYATLGAGPSRGLLGGKLISERNREKDLGPHEMYVVGMPSDVANEDEFIARLFALDAAYGDDARYGFQPNAGDGTDKYNSNSYVMGLLQASKAAPVPWPPKEVPGLNKPLPPERFSISRGGAEWER